MPAKSLIKRLPLFFLAVLGLFLMLLTAMLFMGWPTVDKNTVYGITWSRHYAAYLGIDADKGLQAVLDDLGVRHFRIPAYWTDIEPEPNVYHWETVEQELNQIAQRGGDVILVVGAKQPRWPEWWIPSWAADLPEEQREDAQLAYVTKTFVHFVKHPAVRAWQVESEPSFFQTFGIGKKQATAFIRKEMELVRTLEQMYAKARHLIARPIYTAESGELSLWTQYADLLDGVGVSVYRTVRLSSGRIFRYWFLPPWFYARKALLLKPWITSVYVSEFQQEPWVTKGIIDVPLSTQLETLDIQRLREGFAYAERMHMPRIDFWGAEWWYWMRTRMDHPEFWDEARRFFLSHQKKT